MSAWSVEHAKQLYSMPFWSEGYFDIDAAGRICVQPQGPEGPSLPLPELIEQAARDGVKLPLLLRFSDILPHRLQAMQRAFNIGMGDLGYQGRLHRGVSRSRSISISAWPAYWPQPAANASVWKPAQSRN